MNKLLIFYLLTDNNAMISVPKTDPAENHRNPIGDLLPIIILDK